MSRTVRLRETDVILGRGASVAQHAGNIMFRRFIWNHRMDYEVAERSTKRDVGHVVIKTIANQSPSGRFLEKNAAGHFILVSDKKRILEKTCQALREKKLKHPPLDTTSLNETPAGVRRNSPRKAKKQSNFQVAVKRMTQATCKTAKSNRAKRAALKKKKKKTSVSPPDITTITRVPSQRVTAASDRNEAIRVPNLVGNQMVTRSRARSLSGIINPPEISMAPLLQAEPPFDEQQDHDHNAMLHNDIAIDIPVPDIIYPNAFLAINDINNNNNNDDLFELQLLRTRDLLDEPYDFDANVCMLPPGLTVFYSHIYHDPSNHRRGDHHGASSSPPSVVSHSDLDSCLYSDDDKNQQQQGADDDDQQQDNDANMEDVGYAANA